MSNKFILSFTEEEIVESARVFSKMEKLNVRMEDGQLNLDLNKIVGSTTAFNIVLMQQAIDKYHEWLTANYDLIQKEHND